MQLSSAKMKTMSNNKNQLEKFHFKSKLLWQQIPEAATRGLGLQLY